jgi:hypothetical protein
LNVSNKSVDISSENCLDIRFLSQVIKPWKIRFILKKGGIMRKQSVSRQHLGLPHPTQRKIIGILGTAYPFILSLGALFLFATGIQNSISSYYHTGMQDVFVGILFVIGFFLISYNGYDLADDIVGYVGGISALGSALFPASSHDAAHAVLIGRIHLVFAALFFLSLIYFSLFLFTKTDPSRQPSRKKLHRNKVYKTCGYIMIICLLLIVILHFLPKEIRSPLKAYHPEFWLETIAVVAFGISWLVKGETLLRDEA